jgi:hypothetical protein
MRIIESTLDPYSSLVVGIDRVSAKFYLFRRQVISLWLWNSNSSFFRVQTVKQGGTYVLPLTQERNCAVFILLSSFAVRLFYGLNSYKLTGILAWSPPDSRTLVAWHFHFLFKSFDPHGIESVDTEWYRTCLGCISSTGPGSGAHFRTKVCFSC